MESNVRKRAENILRVKPGSTQYAISRVDADPISAFRLFISNDILSEIVNMTNKEGRNIYGESWIEVDRITIEAYIGLIMLAGVYNAYRQSLEELFHVNNRAEYRATFSMKRFKMITRALRFDDRAERDRERDKLAPIRYILLRIIVSYRFIF